MKSFLTLLTILATAVCGFAQQGTLSGTVTDKTSGESIIGAVVFIKGSSKGTATDVDGRYSLPLDAGLYQISITSLSYKPTEHTNIKIEPGKTTTLDVQIEQNSTEIQTVTIVGTRQTNTDLALMESMRQSEVVVSGASGEQIAKSLDRDAAETVKRIPGVTIMNDRYIVIRGMNERYNTVMLNDVLAPSTEPDAKSFSFDILPTSVIDRIMIYKNGSPELPGEFGGGVIKVYTKNLVDENRTSFSLSSSFRSGTTLRGFKTYTGSETDFLGFDNGQRQLPSNFPDYISSGNTEELARLGSQLPNTWAPQNTTAIPDLRASLDLARRFDIGNVRFGNITAISYSNTRTFLDNARRTRYESFEPSLGRSTVGLDYRDDISTQNVRLSAIHNWSARLNNYNKLEFRNMFVQLGQSEVLERSGTENFNQLDQRNTSLRYLSRTIYQGNLQGTHDSRDEKTTLTWTGGYTYTNRDEPDFRRVRTQRPMGTNEPYAVAFKMTPSLADAGRFYSELNERTYTANSQLEHRFNPADSTSENAPKVRVGFYAERKDRDFNARFFSYRPANTELFDQQIPFQPLDQVFAPGNINPQSGLVITEGTNPSDTYTASNTMVAGYIGGATPLGAKLSVAGGARVEYNLQELSTRRLGGASIEVSNPILRVLPAANLTYILNPRSVVRAGASMSLNRPEFRELAPFTYFDFNSLFEISGNPALKTPTIYNADLRYEFYPNPTEVLSLGVFGKYFQNPIENYFEVTNIGNAITFGNADNATSYGLEAEVRKSLLDLSGSRFIQNMTLVLNAALIRSDVKLGQGAIGQSGSRPMMGQSPYVLNAGLYYQDEPSGLQVNLLYNVVGKRIFVVGSYANPTVYEMPRHLVDLSVTKSFGRNFEIKGGIQDLLNQSVHLIQDSDGDGKIGSVDETVQKFNRGTYSTLGVSYKF
ncbi:TonB-dependent receptor [Pontibacter roseus]|uniref:TonB-dependent receptor n=1 Tax=Pontibacter roseus TaxID=336989 RepID=UPI000376D059|nr:TonB-dependent receptor [Pontibacter roseus]